jgi:hypothetical protein
MPDDSSSSSGEKASLQTPRFFESTTALKTTESVRKEKGYGTHAVPKVSAALSKLRARDAGEEDFVASVKDSTRKKQLVFASDDAEFDSSNDREQYGRVKSVVCRPSNVSSHKVCHAEDRSEQRSPSRDRCSQVPSPVPHREEARQSHVAADRGDRRYRQYTEKSSVENPFRRRHRDSSLSSDSSVGGKSVGRSKSSLRRDRPQTRELSSRTRQHPHQSSPVDTCDSDVEPSPHRHGRREVKVEAGRRAATGRKGRDSSSGSGSSTSRERGNRRRRYSKDHRDSPSSPGRSHGRRHRRDCEHERVGHSRRRDRDSASPRSSKDRGRHRSKSAGPRHKMKPGRFDGTQSLETFLAQFATCAEYNRWSEKDKCAFLKCALSGGAAQLLWDAGNPEKLTYEQLKEKLEARYGSVGQAEKFRVELQSRRRRSGESLTDLHADIRRLMAMAYPGAHGNSVCELIARDHFLTALGDRQLELKLREREPGDLDTALRLALRLEAYASSLKRETDGRSSSPKQRRDRDRGDDRLAHRIAQIEKTLSASTPQTRDEGATEWRRRYDELMKDYEKLKLLDEQRRTVTTTVDVPKAKEDARTRPAYSEYRCYGCGETGHIRRSCPSEQLRRRKVDKSEGTGDSTQPSGDVVNVRGATSATKDENSAYIRLRIQGTPVDCLLDSGAEATIIPWSLAQGADIQPYRQQLRAANGTVIPVIGRTTLVGYANSRYLEIDGLVSKRVPNVILGLAWLRRQAAVWDFKAGSIKLGGHVFALRGSSTRSWCRRVVAQEPVVIPALSEAVLPADVIYNDLGRQSASGKAWTTKVAEPRPGLRVSRSIIPDRASDVPVRVMNVTRQEIQFEAGEVIAELQPVTPCTTSVTAVEDSDIDKLSVLEDLVRRVDATVPRGARKELHDLDSGTPNDATPAATQASSPSADPVPADADDDVHVPENPRRRERRKPRRYDQYICGFSVVSGVTMPKKAGECPIFRCRACDRAFSQKRNFARHLRDSAARSRHVAFFGDPANRRKLLTESGLRWEEISSQPLIDRTLERRQPVLGAARVNVVNTNSPLPGGRWFHGPQGRSHLETLVHSVLTDPDCGDVASAVEKVIHMRPDLTDDEAELLVLAGAAGAQLVSCVAADHYAVSRSLSRCSRRQMRCYEVDLNRWQAGLQDDTVRVVAAIGRPRSPLTDRFLDVAGHNLPDEVRPSSKLVSTNSATLSTAEASLVRADTWQIQDNLSDVEPDTPLGAAQESDTQVVAVEEPLKASEAEIWQGLTLYDEFNLSDEVMDISAYNSFDC